MNEPRETAPPRDLTEAEARLLEEAVKLYRARDGLINRPELYTLLLNITGCMQGVRVALCVMRGWSVEEESDKEGQADELVVAAWQARHPEDWNGGE